MIVGYARVSTEQQTTDLQIDALKKYGCDVLYQDCVSGVKFRPELERCLASLVTGDTLVVWKFDRLGRTAYHLTRLIQELTEKGVFFVSITQGFDTSTASGKFMSTVMAGAAEYERDVLIERINAGIGAARARGVKCGRPTWLDTEAAQGMRDMGMRVQDIAKRLGVSRATIYNHTV